jgi:predicted Ser/Thr protein kinase
VLTLSIEAKSVVKHSRIPFPELIIEKELGKGSYGKVYLGKWNNAPVALKFCRKKENIEDFAKEIRVMLYGIVIVIVIVIVIERY